MPELGFIALLRVGVLEVVAEREGVERGLLGLVRYFDIQRWARGGVHVVAIL